MSRNARQEDEISVKFHKFSRKEVVMEPRFSKTVSPHAYNCIKKDTITGVFL